MHSFVSGFCLHHGFETHLCCSFFLIGESHYVSTLCLMDIWVILATKNKAALNTFEHIF